jgi:hypothetical protein
MKNRKEVMKEFRRCLRRVIMDSYDQNEIKILLKNGRKIKLLLSVSEEEKTELKIIKGGKNKEIA